MIRVVVPFCNAAPYLRYCLVSLIAQREKRWHCYLIDDCSHDNSIKYAAKFAVKDSRFTLLVNNRKQYVPGNYWQVAHMPEVDPQDIIVNLDGDDRLSDPDVFSRLTLAYRPDVWVTWGSYLVSRGGRLSPGKLSQPVFDVTAVRRLKWRTSHLRTFRAFLLQAIKEEDLRSPITGNFWEAGGDLALMFPILEMATSQHAKFLKSINYIYTEDNPLADSIVQRDAQLKNEQLLRAMPSYSPFCV